MSGNVGVSPPFGMVETAPNCGTSEAPMRGQMKAWAQYMKG